MSAQPPEVGTRVDTPLGLGTVQAIGFHEELLGGPYVTVALEAKGMTPEPDGTGLFAVEDVERFDG